MKNTIAILALSVAGAYTGFSQGEIAFNNTSHTRISVNSAVGGAATAQSPDTSTFYYALFSSASATNVSGSITASEIPTGVGAGTYAFTDTADWTFDGTANMAISSTSTAGALGAITTDSAGFTQIPGEPANAYFVVVGWSSNIGSTLQSVETWLAGGDGAELGYLGESAVSGLIATGTAGSSSPPPTLFGTVSPNIAAFTLGQFVPSPEPSTIALGVMGACSLLAFRRKKA